MEDALEHFRALKTYRKALRKRMVSCEGTCKERFGTPTKVTPGQKCKHCDWVAPEDGHTQESWLKTQGIHKVNRDERKEVE